jgi:hypothetical protein
MHLRTIREVTTSKHAWVMVRTRPHHHPGVHPGEKAVLAQAKGVMQCVPTRDEDHRRPGVTTLVRLHTG